MISLAEKFIYILILTNLQIEIMQQKKAKIIILDVIFMINIYGKWSAAQIHKFLGNKKIRGNFFSIFLSLSWTHQHTRRVSRNGN